jgi:hypothetical protein
MFTWKNAERIKIVIIDILNQPYIVSNYQYLKLKIPLTIPICDYLTDYLFRCCLRHVYLVPLL